MWWRYILLLLGVFGCSTSVILIKASTTHPTTLPAARLLIKCGFELAGVDTQRHSNHDLVKEVASLIWYAALD